MTTLPISFVFMTSTKQHWGHKDVYLKTLNHWARHMPFAAYSVKVAHIKVSPNDESIAADMARELEARGFKVLTTVGAWSRGQSHQNQYLIDQIKVSKEPSLYRNPLILFVEDDSIIMTGDQSLDALLSKSAAMLDDPDVMSVRVMRPNDWPPAGSYQVIDNQIFRHEHINFQPLLMRSHQFHSMLKTAEDNLTAASTVQIEMLWRLLLAPYSRAPLPHVVWNRDVAHTIHLGTPDYPALKSSLGLS